MVRRPEEKENHFFSDSGKALQLNKVILRVCDIEVSERDELPHDKALRLDKNLEIFASYCQSTQKELERQLSTQSTENPRKIPHS